MSDQKKNNQIDQYQAVLEAICQDVILIGLPDSSEKIDLARKKILEQTFSFSRDVNDLQRIELIVDMPLKDASEFAGYELLLFNEEFSNAEPYISYPNDPQLNDPDFDFNRPIHIMKKYIKLFIHLEVKQSTDLSKIAKSIFSAKGLSPSKDQDTMNVPIIMLFDDDLVGVEFKKLKTMILDRDLQSVKFVNIGLMAEGADFWVKTEYPFMFILAILMQPDQKKRAKMKRAMLRAIENSDMSIDQKVKLRLSVEQILLLRASL